MNLTHAAEMSDVNAAWLAGLLDGEGCFDDPRGNPRIRVKMTDLDLILRAADIMDGTTYGETPARENYKPLLVAAVHGEKAVAVMRAILPWMSSRRSAHMTGIITRYAAKKNGRIRLLKLQEAA